MHLHYILHLTIMSSNEAVHVILCHILTLPLAAQSCKAGKLRHTKLRILDRSSRHLSTHAVA